MNRNSKQSNGIKRADNGAIGESRTKSFLIDRFWILERSVDIEGADFLIQRKLLSQSILDNNPPRFGVIQSKFSQDEKTRHKIKREYIEDGSGNPHMEFFLIVNIGHEDSQKICLLSAQDIVNNFSLNEDNEYVILTKKLLPKYLVGSKSRSLNYIEQSIQCVDFYKNRLYVFKELNSFNPDFDAIHPDFKISIEYNDGNIPDLFKEQKTRAYDFMLEIEEIHSALMKFVQEVRPIESCYIAQLFNTRYKDYLKIPEIFDKNFYYKAKNYAEQIENLKNDGILDIFISFREIIRNDVNHFLLSNIDKIDSMSHHIISIKYNSNDLSNLQVNNEILSKPDSDNIYFKYLDLKEGEFKVSTWIGNHLNNIPLIHINEVCLNDILNKIYELKYFKNDNND